METYEGVIFDFNGTLFFDDDKHVLAWGEISRLLRGRDITDERNSEHSKHSIYDGWKSK